MTNRPPEDRRRHVRARPTADFEVEAWVVEGIVTERVRVVDVSVAGLGLLIEDTLAEKMPGNPLKLRLHVPQRAAFEVDAIVRHVTHRTGICGVEIDRADESAMRTLSQTVSELLERAG
jgi:hypothetical protein